MKRKVIVVAFLTIFIALVGATVYVLRVAYAGPRRPIAVPRVYAGSTLLVFSPDGGTLVTFGGHSYDFWDTRSGKKTFSLPLLRQGILGEGAFGFSPDGMYFVAGVGSDNDLVLHDATTRTPLRGLGSSAGVSGVFQFSRDGRWLAGSGAIWSLASGAKLRDLQGAFIGFACDDAKVVEGRPNEGVIISDVAGTASRRIFCDPNGLAISPDGRRLATTISIIEIATGERVPHTQERFSQAVAWSLDSTTLACADREHASFHDAGSGSVWRRIPGSWDDILFSSEKDVVALVGLMSKGGLGVSFFHVPTGRLLEEIPREPGNIVLAPDGRSIALLPQGHGPEARFKDAYVYDISDLR